MRTWLAVKEHLSYGLLCPSCVFDSENNMVAIFTNLSTKGGGFSAIRLSREPLFMMPELYRHTRARFASVSVFLRTETSM